MKQEKNLNANVDFYSASTYYSLGIPVDLFTPVFAISRMSGWTAHVLEQYHNNRLIRPRAEYKGNPDGMPWMPHGGRANVDERAYYTESQATKPATLALPFLQDRRRPTICAGWCARRRTASPPAPMSATAPALRNRKATWCCWTTKWRARICAAGNGSIFPA